MRVKQSTQDAYNELASYTLEHPDQEYFIHQHIVDAYALETADTGTKPIRITFALVGLYLFLEKHFTGKQVQRAHMALAGQRKTWPVFSLPQNRGDITIFDVIHERAGTERDEMIWKWCASVWTAWDKSQKQVRDLVKNELDI